MGSALLHMPANGNRKVMTFPRYECTIVTEVQIMTCYNRMLLYCWKWVLKQH